MDFQTIGDYILEHAWFLLFVLLYSVLVFAFSPLSPLLYDNALYADIARNLIQEHCFCSNSEIAAVVPPVFPLLAALFMLAFGDFFIKPLLVSVAAFAALSGYHLVLRISGSRRTATLATTLFLTTPLLIYNSMLLLTDVLFAGLLFSAIWAYLAAGQSRKRRYALLLAVFAALAIMTRFVGYLLIPLFLVHSLLRRKEPGIGMKALCLALLLVLVLILPWTLWRASILPNELKVAGLLTEPGYGHLVLAAESFYPDGTPMNTNPISIDLAVPVQLVTFIRAAASLLIFVTPLISLAFLVFLLRPGFCRRQRYKSLVALWFLIFLLFHILVFFYIDSRYLIPLALPMALVFSWLVERNLDSRKWLALALVLAQLISAAGIIYLDSQLRWDRLDTGVFEQAGLWIRDNTPGEATFLSLGAPQGALVYYSERDSVPLNQTPPDIIVESDFGFSPLSLQEYEEQSGSALTLLKEFSDSRYYARVYARS